MLVIDYEALSYSVFACSKSTMETPDTCSKLTIKIAERRHCRHSGVFIANFEQISDIILAFSC